MNRSGRSPARLDGVNEGRRGFGECRTAFNRRWLLFVVGATACATTDALVGQYQEPPAEHHPVPDNVPDSGPDASSTEADAGSCADCEYFPETCTPETFCLNGPFDPNTAGGSIDLRTQINVIRGRSPSDVWAAGALGALAHFDGTSWTRSNPGERETLRALWLRDSAEISLGMFERVYARGAGIADAGAAPSSDGWTVHATALPPTAASGWAEFVSAWAPDGSEWLWCAARAWAPGATNGIWRLRQSPSRTFEVGTVVAPEVCKTSPCSQIASIHGASANDLWAVGLTGATVRITDATSDTPNIETFYSQTWNALNGVWAASASEAWSVGAMGTIRHYTGQSSFWDVVSNVPTIEDLNAVWGSSSSDVWAVGDAGVVLHYDGKSWSRVKVAGLGPRRPNLTTVWVAGPGHVWIGGQGVILSLGGKP